MLVFPGQITSLVSLIRVHILVTYCVYVSVLKHGTTVCRKFDISGLKASWIREICVIRK